MMSIRQGQCGAVARQAGRRLAGLAGFAAGGLALSAAYRYLGIGVPCPFLMLTGWQCPLCGGTRMGSALLAGDVVAAFAFNPVALLGLAVLAVLAGSWLVQWRGGTGLHVPAGLRNRVGALPGWVRTMLWVLPLVGWMVVRNL